MNLEAIGAYLGTKGCGAVGKSIFVTEMPDSCIQGILLMGAYKGTPVNHELPGYFVSDFQMVIRGTDYVAALGLAKKASIVLTTHAGFSASGMLVRQCLPRNLPRPYRQSVGGYWEFEVDVEIVFVDTAA